MSVPTALGNNVTTRVITYRPLVLESWGEEWGKRSIVYRFSDGITKESTDSTNRGFYVPNGGSGGN